jgi:nucleotide-binding universal stress UspA family protein
VVVEQEDAMSIFPARVLLATDGSPEAALAARMAVELCEETGSELHVVYVAAIPNLYISPELMLSEPDSVDRLDNIARSEGQKVLKEQLKKIEELGGKVSESYLRVGRVDENIVRLGESMGADVIVLGSRGYNPMTRLLMGSVSDSVVRHAHCAVLVVRRQVRVPERLLGGRVLLATDGSEEARAAAGIAAELAERTGAELHLVHALPTDPPMPYPAPFSRERSAALIEQAKRDARTFLADEAGRLEKEGFSGVQTHLRLGRPGQEIVKLSEELDADLVILGSRGLGGMRRALMGGVSDSVVRHAPCPVLVVRR